MKESKYIRKNKGEVLKKNERKSSPKKGRRNLVETER